CSQDLPPPHRVGIDRHAALLLVGAEEVSVVAESSDRSLDAEAPRLDAQPAEILHRVAEMGELPVEDGADAVGADDEVAVAEITVDDRTGNGRLFPPLLLQPPEPKLE